MQVIRGLTNVRGDDTLPSGELLHRVDAKLSSARFALSEGHPGEVSRSLFGVHFPVYVLASLLEHSRGFESLEVVTLDRNNVANGGDLVSREGEPVAVRHVGDANTDREEEEGNYPFPQGYDVRSNKLKNDEKPDVGENREEPGDGEHTGVRDPSESGLAIIVSLGNATNAHCYDDEQIESSRANNGRWPEFSSEVARGQDLDNVEENFGRRGSEGHQGKICDSLVPDLGGGEGDREGGGSELVRRRD